MTRQGLWVASVLYLLPISAPAPFMEKALAAVVIPAAALLSGSAASNQCCTSDNPVAKGGPDTGAAACIKVTNGTRPAQAQSPASLLFSRPLYMLYSCKGFHGPQRGR